MGSQAVTARWWREDDGVIVCELCPRACRIAAGESGFCRMRRNDDGVLIAESYGYPLGMAIDPIEKKPLFHFLPGSEVLSFGTAGCTLACRFCQNWSLSQNTSPGGKEKTVEPERIVEMARREQVSTIAYTYNEPTVFGEYLADVATLAWETGIKNVMVSNGYVTLAAREEIYRFIDGVNIDLKAFDDTFYREQTSGALAPVLDTLEWVNRQPDIWLEITTLLIPGLNDSSEQVEAECRWIVEKLGKDVPLHLTAFHPDYKMGERPRTSVQILRTARELALNAGLRFVYTGNVTDGEGQSTRCPVCGKIVISRDMRRTKLTGLNGSDCAACGRRIAGVFME